MYLPAHFEETRAEPLHALLRNEPLGLLVTQDAAGALAANNLPFVLDADPAGGPGILRAHVARANPLWREARGDVDSLVVFQGPQAYISPSMYPTKAATGKVVPTWNYITVHAHGTIEFFDDKERLLDLVTRLTDRHESKRAEPWAVSDAPADYIQAHLKGIVGFRLPIARLAGKWKMSQNRNAEDRQGVVDGLGREGGLAESAVADIMARDLS